MLVSSLASVAAVVLVPLSVQAAKPHPSTLVQPHAETVRRPVHQACLDKISLTDALPCLIGQTVPLRTHSLYARTSGA